MSHLYFADISRSSFPLIVAFRVMIYIIGQLFYGNVYSEDLLIFDNNGTIAIIKLIQV